MKFGVILLILSLQITPVPQPDSDEGEVNEERDATLMEEAEDDRVPLHIPPRPREPISVPEEAFKPQEASSSRISQEGNSSWEAAFSPENWAAWSLTVAVLAAAIAGIWTAILLGRQLRVVSQPRLYVDAVRFTGLVAGSRPVFFARIGNAGPTDAHNVTVTINATYGAGGGGVGAPQKMTVPAYSSREFFVRWKAALTSAVRNDIEAGTSKLSVEITVQSGDGKPLECSYQYHTWDNDRPPGVPDFVPSDSDSQLVTR